MSKYRHKSAVLAHKPSVEPKETLMAPSPPDSIQTVEPIPPVEEALSANIERPAMAEAPLQEQVEKVAEPLPTLVPLDSWQMGGVAVTGLAHWRQGLPCQDAVAWRSHPRPILALSDGAGSAAASHQGSALLVQGLTRFVMSMEDAIAAWLDTPAMPDTTTASIWSQRLLAHATGLLEDLAERERRPVKDFRATALLTLVGRQQVFCWQVGDGAIIAQCNDALTVVSTGVKGEFANQTVFVDAARAEEVCYAILPTAEVTGLALMSDGGAERLVAAHSGKIATRLDRWLAALSDRQLCADQLAVAYHEAPMWERTSLDDRAIVMAARPLGV